MIASLRQALRIRLKWRTGNIAAYRSGGLYVVKLAAVDYPPVRDRAAARAAIRGEQRSALTALKEQHHAAKRHARAHALARRTKAQAFVGSPQRPTRTHRRRMRRGTPSRRQKRVLELARRHRA